MRLRPRFSPLVILSSAVLLASVLLPLPKNGLILGLPSPCPFFHLTGLPCPGCGLTRSFVCCGHGRLEEAFVWHPLGPLLFLATLLFVLDAVFDWRVAARVPPRALYFSIFAFGVFWILRLDGVLPLPTS